MEVSGKIYKILEPVTGESSRGSWKRQNFVIEIPSEFSKKACFSVWNDKANLTDLQENDEVTVFFEIESREFKDNWYTDLRCWRIDRKASGGASSGGMLSQAAAAAAQPAPQQPAEPVPFDSGSIESSADDDLPF